MLFAGVRFPRVISEAKFHFPGVIRFKSVDIFESWKSLESCSDVFQRVIQVLSLNGIQRSGVCPVGDPDERRERPDAAADFPVNPWPIRTTSHRCSHASDSSKTDQIQPVRGGNSEETLTLLFA